jgi:Protein of unknown function (DUF2924)
MREQLERLRGLNVPELRLKYRELFGEESRSPNRQFLYRRVAWRLQALAEGDISERARRRALEIANDADLRIQASRWDLTPEQTLCSRDRRLPPAGTVLRRDFRGRSIEVQVLQDGFEYQQQQYGSLSAVAWQVTGTRWNGFLFFGLTGTKRGRRG